MVMLQQTRMIEFFETQQWQYPWFRHTTPPPAKQAPFFSRHHNIMFCGSKKKYRSRPPKQQTPAPRSQSGCRQAPKRTNSMLYPVTIPRSISVHRLRIPSMIVPKITPHPLSNPLFPPHFLPAPTLHPPPKATDVNRDVVREKRTPGPVYRKRHLLQ